jgi:hypothetical protein
MESFWRFKMRRYNEGFDGPPGFDGPIGYELTSEQREYILSMVSETELKLNQGVSMKFFIVATIFTCFTYLTVAAGATLHQYNTQVVAKLIYNFR